MMRILRWLGRTLPSSLRDVAVADLERELSVRRTTRGRWRSEWIWLPSVALALLARVWASRLVGGGRTAVERGVPGMLDAVRVLSRSPALSLVAILVIALGVSAPTTMYTVGDALTRGLPVPAPEELVSVSHVSGRWTTVRRALTRLELETLREADTTLGEVAAYQAITFDVRRGGAAPERVAGARVSHRFLELLRESTTLGRDFGPDDVGQPVAVVGERYWRTRYASDPETIGGRLRLNGVQHTVIGVFPKGLRLPAGAEIWVPLPAADATDALSAHLETLSRVPAGTPAFEVAQEQVHAIPTPSATTEPGAHFAPRRVQDRLNVGSTSRRFFLGVLAMVTCLLLVAAFNVTNLLLCRAVERQHEIAIRTALGASRLHVWAMHLTEATVVCVVGGALGFAGAWKAVAGFRWASAGQLGWWVDVAVDVRMAAFATGLVVVSAILAGVIPALQTSSRAVATGLQATPQGGGAFRLTWLSERLVVLQVMFSAALLVQAVYVAGVFVNPSGWSTGGAFEADDVLVAAYAFRPGERDAPGERLSFHRTVLDGVMDRGSIRAAAVMTPPPGGTGPSNWVVPSDHPDIPRYDRDATLIVRVSPGTFDLLGLPVLRGRDLTWEDAAAGAPVALVNEAYLERFFPDSDGVGDAIRFIPPGRAETVTATIVGVAPPLGGSSFMGGEPDAIYVPITTGTMDETQVMVKTAGGRDPMNALVELRSAVDAIAPEKPLFAAASLDTRLERSLAMILAVAGLFVFAGLASIVMAGSGLYAVMAFAVGRRTHEIGVRAALGATRSQMLSAVLGRAAYHLVQGLFLGLVLALGMADRFLFAERDPVILTMVAGGILGVGFLAAVTPAVRALRVEPTVSLRSL